MYEHPRSYANSHDATPASAIQRPIEIRAIGSAIHLLTSASLPHQKIPAGGKQPSPLIPVNLTLVSSRSCDVRVTAPGPGQIP